MSNFVAKRIRFRNGERVSVLVRPYGLPVHEATLFLERYRKRGRAANTLHSTCSSLALMYRELSKLGIDPAERVRSGRFLTAPELSRLADAAQRRVDDLSEEDEEQDKPNVIDIRRIRTRLKAKSSEVVPVDVGTQATRLRHMAGYLDFLVGYFGAALEAGQRSALERDSARALEGFISQVPPVSRRAKLGAREGLSQEDQDRLLSVVHPESPENPWKRGFVRKRNWLVVVLLLATGMRRGELLGLQVGDFNRKDSKLTIYRRADVVEDPRVVQPATKTNDRELELRPAIMKAAWDYISQHRHGIKAARKHPLFLVSDEGEPLSAKSIDKMFAQLRTACPSLPVRLTSHVMRHTWNERFSEQADRMELSDVVEEKARNEQQGWTDNSKSAATYTRRHVTRKGREIALKLQEKLDGSSQ